MNFEGIIPPGENGVAGYDVTNGEDIVIPVGNMPEMPQKVELVMFPGGVRTVVGEAEVVLEDGLYIIKAQIDDALGHDEVSIPLQAPGGWSSSLSPHRHIVEERRNTLRAFGILSAEGFTISEGETK